MKTNVARWMKWSLPAAGFCFALTAWAQMDMSGPNSSMDMPGMKMSPADAKFTEAMDASMKKMDRNMASEKMTGDPDHDFVVMMIPIIIRAPSTWRRWS